MRERVAYDRTLSYMSSPFPHFSYKALEVLLRLVKGPNAISCGKKHQHPAANLSPEMYYCVTFVQVFILRAGGEDHRHLLCYLCSGLYHSCRGWGSPPSFAQTIPISTVYLFIYISSSTISLPYTFGWSKLDIILCGATSTSCHNLYLYYYGLFRSSSSIQGKRIAYNISIDNPTSTVYLFTHIHVGTRLRWSAPLIMEDPIFPHSHLIIHRSNLLNPLIAICVRLFIHQSTIANCWCGNPAGHIRVIHHTCGTLVHRPSHVY